MPNRHCECALSGYCQRHQVHKNDHQFALCRGTAPTLDCGRKYFIAWERGLLGATAPANPVLNPEPFCVQSRGLGDKVARTIQVLTGGTIKPCGGCKDRQATLNHWLPSSVEPVRPVSLANATRHLTFHVWPVAGYGAWQWNCDQLLAHAGLFNGRRLVAIAVGDECDSPDKVREYLKDFTTDFIIVKNSSTLREVASWIPMLELLEPYQSENDVTFSCHGKCVRHKISRHSVEASGSTLFRWTELMYESCLKWERVQPLLETHGTVGSFRRFNAHQRGKHGFGPWHYSGTFYWWRNRDAYRRNWRYVPQRFYGTEAWPGIMFTKEESGVLFADDVQDLYQLPYWTDTIEPLWSKWSASCSSK